VHVHTHTHTHTHILTKSKAKPLAAIYTVTHTHSIALRHISKCQSLRYCWEAAITALHTGFALCVLCAWVGGYVYDRTLMYSYILPFEAWYSHPWGSSVSKPLVISAGKSPWY